MHHCESCADEYLVWPSYCVEALKEIRATVGTPKHFRMIVALRDGSETLLANYRMFTHWGWIHWRPSDGNGTFNKFVRKQLDALRQCNSTLYRTPALLEDLRAPELLAYFNKCWRGSWDRPLDYALPYVCLRAWLAAGFARKQFLLVHSANLRRMRATPFLRAIANFTGLFYNHRASPLQLSNPKGDFQHPLRVMSHES